MNINPFSKFDNNQTHTNFKSGMEHDEFEKV